ncbi:MAG: YjjG family noncanonical pyrimidine nucleotidase [Clostridia bacterium]|nr:YjjG family noncanonical pyrimidine nucleotidase [Clostridia bacterium]
MIKTIFLDADDTVFDFGMAQREAFFSAFKTLGYPCDEKIYDRYDEINISQWKKLERGETTKDKLVYDRFIQLFDEMRFNGDVKKTEEYYQNFLGEQAFWLDGAKEGVTYLSKKYDVYLTTNGHADTQRKRVEKSGLIRIVKGMFVSESVGFSKPQKEYYDYCFSVCNAKKEETICIGDSLTSDIKGGREYGLKTMWFNLKNEPVPPEKPDYIVHSWDEIKSIL